MTSGPASSQTVPLRRSLLCAIIVVFTVTIARAEEPVKTSICQLKKDPPAWDHKLVEVTGFVTHASRNFTIFDPTCPSFPAIWLEYGGTVTTGTVNCCKTIEERRRSQELVIDGIPIPLTVNQPFQDFDKAIQPPFRPGQSGAVGHATLIGRFFAGQQMEDSDNGKYWGGYGSMGCCSLLAIQEVKDPDTEWHADLDYGESNEKLDVPHPGCTLRMLLPAEQDAALMQFQRDADSGTRDWVFTDPARVAADALSRAAKVSPDLLAGIKLTRDSPARKTYEWKSAASAKSYTAVVSRPYWLSFYARDPKRVAWVAVIAYEATCGSETD
ncbi:MAG TPA: hypothetical protein VK596_05495 [Edaphobacter sp.]|nr:hypothetical protein [Edaphobacter sp.]